MIIKNIHEEEYAGYEGTAFLDHWDCEVNVVFPSEDKREYAEKCVKFLQDMSEDFKKRFSKYAYRYFQEMVEEVGEECLEDMPADVKEEDILEFVYPNVIIVDEECRDDRVEFHVECNCGWEIEHGLEITVSDGKILYVGGFDDMPPYNTERLEYVGFYDEDEDMNMNYADKES